MQQVLEIARDQKNIMALVELLAGGNGNGKGDEMCVLPCRLAVAVNSLHSLFEAA